MPEPVTARIGRIVESVPGWTPPDELLALHMLAVTTAPLGGDVVEIGSWCGRSTAVLGHAVASTGVGHVWAIDLFPERADWTTNPDGSHSMSVDIGGEAVDAYTRQTVWDEPFQRDIATLYQQAEGVLHVFQRTIDGEELGAVVTPFRGTGRMFAARAPENMKVRLAFLDGDHSYEAVVADIEAVQPFLQSGGWIAFDDAFSVYEGVDAAIREHILGSGLYDQPQQMCRKFFVARRK
jgi:hypothetical protein